MADDVLELLGRMHLDAIANGDWEGAAALAQEIAERASGNSTSPGQAGRP